MVPEPLYLSTCVACSAKHLSPSTQKPASVRNPDRNPSQFVLLLLESDAFRSKRHGPDENLGNNVLIQCMGASRMAACMMSGSRMGKAVMIQHNDSDTSCMRAYAPLERTLASEAELVPRVVVMWQSCQAS